MSKTNLQRRSRRTGQTGFLVLGCVLALAATAIIVAIAIDRTRQERRWNDANVLAASLAEATRNVESFVVGYHSQLSSDVDVIKRFDDVSVALRDKRRPDFGDILRLTESRVIGPYAPIIRNGKFAVMLDIPYLRDPACANKPFGAAKKCDIRGVVYIDTPYPRSGSPDFSVLGRAATALGADGGYSTLSDPANFLFGSARSAASGNLTARVANPQKSSGLLAKRFGDWSQSTGYSISAGVADDASRDNRAASAASFSATTLSSLAAPQLPTQYNGLPPLFQRGDSIDSQSGQTERNRRLGGARDRPEPVDVRGGPANSLLGNISMQNHTFNSRLSAVNHVMSVGDLFINRLSVPTVESLRGLSALYNLHTERTVVSQFLGVLSVVPPGGGGAEPLNPARVGENCGSLPALAVGITSQRQRGEQAAPQAYGPLQCVNGRWRNWSNDWGRRRAPLNISGIPRDLNLGEWRYCRDVSEQRDRGVNIVPTEVGPSGFMKWEVITFAETDTDLKQTLRITCFD